MSGRAMTARELPRDARGVAISVMYKDRSCENF